MTPEQKDLTNWLRDKYGATLNQEQAAEALNVHKMTLLRMRSEAVGPEWRKVRNRIIYPAGAIAAFICNVQKTA
ncbi:MAG: hypothetical protein AB7E49_10695 [Campylobacterales bacterium]